MEVVNARNVNYALVKGIGLLKKYGLYVETRNGPARMMSCPVTTTYAEPMERVLFANGSRNPNPFFHVFESLWMLSGRNDARWLDTFIADFSSRYALEDGTQHGAYGKRWMHWFVDRDENDLDQIRVVIDKLRVNPHDRRVVIQMWDPQEDLQHQGPDIPCNLTLVPQIVENRLDINVFCRSNDLVWGAYGANAVHFSVLQEYLAAGVGVPVGKYRQISVNYHVYKATLPSAPATGWVARDPYNEGLVTTTPFVTDFESFSHELREFMRRTELGHYIHDASGYKNSFFPDVAVPMWNANLSRREKKRAQAMEWAAKVGGLNAKCDWRLASLEFLNNSKWKDDF